jgi:hypothetical protein
MEGFHSPERKRLLELLLEHDKSIFLKEADGMNHGLLAGLGAGVKNADHNMIWQDIAWFVMTHTRLRRVRSFQIFARSLAGLKLDLNTTRDLFMKTIHDFCMPTRVGGRARLVCAQPRTLA